MKNEDQSQFEKKVKISMEKHGMFFPSTEEEVEVFEKLYGSTDVEMPVHLKDATYLISKGNSGEASSNEYSNQVNLAQAARDGHEIPKDIRAKMRVNRQKAEEKYKNKND